MSTFQTGLTSDLSLARLGKPGGFAQLGPAIRILCPDKFTVYHYNLEDRILKKLKDHRGLTPAVMTPHKVEGFLEALCAFILPQHKAHIIYNVCKIPFLSYEKENA